MMPNYGVYPQQTQRLNYLEQQMAQQNNMFLKGRPVTSIDEVKGALIDFNGSIFYFPDQSNNRIYTKQIGLNGQSVLRMYELTELPVDKPQSQEQYVTQTEFTSTIDKLVAELKNIKQGENKQNERDESTKSNEFTF